jgi:hypothetical protein
MGITLLVPAGQIAGCVHRPLRRRASECAYGNTADERGKKLPRVAFRLYVRYQT